MLAGTTSTDDAGDGSSGDHGEPSQGAPLGGTRDLATREEAVLREAEAEDAAEVTEKETQAFIKACNQVSPDKALAMLLGRDGKLPRGFTHGSDRTGCTALEYASIQGHLELARQLLQEGAAVGQAMHGGTAPLYLASGNGRLAVATLLLDKGANADQSKQDGTTPLMIAAERNHPDVVELLVEKGRADVKLADGQWIYRSQPR